MASGSSLVRNAVPAAATTRGGFSPCRASPLQRSCGCAIPLNPPPKTPDPWTYDKAISQYAQFTQWQSAPVTAKAPTFWIQASIDLYSTMPQRQLPPAPSPFVLVTVGNNSNVAAVNALVQLSMSYQGIGRVKVPVTSQYATIESQQTITLSFNVPASFLNQTVTIQTAGGPETIQVPQQFLGVYIDVQHPYDSNVLNNHAISMWQGLDIAGGDVVSPAIRVLNEFSTQTETITLTIIPAKGVIVSGAPGPIVIAPGQEVVTGFNLTIPPWMDGGTFLVEIATVVGTTASGAIVGGVTVVGAVND
jgi:hypothetical protein